MAPSAVLERRNKHGNRQRWQRKRASQPSAAPGGAPRAGARRADSDNGVCQIGVVNWVPRGDDCVALALHAQVVVNGIDDKGLFAEGARTPP